MFKLPANWRSQLFWLIAFAAVLFAFLIYDTSDWRQNLWDTARSSDLSTLSQ